MLAQLRLLAAVSLAVSTPACSVIEAYPPLLEVCDNGIDDDGDGTIDCRGAPCLGTPSCAEETIARCTDGYDDDGDERVDFEDPACWPVGVATLERCASVLGGTRISQFWNGHTADPTVHGFHATRVVAVETSPDRPLPAARSTAQLAGALAGLHATIEIYVPHADATRGPAEGLTISLFDATTYRDISFQFVVSFELGDTGLTTLLRAHAPSGDVETPYSEDWAPIDAWFTLELAIRGDDASGLVLSANVLGSTDALEVPVPSDFPRSRALAIGATAGVLGIPDVTVLPMVSNVELHRDPYLRCTDEDRDAAVWPAGITPPFGVDDAQSNGSVSYEWMTALAQAPDGSLCGLVYENDTDTPDLVAARLADGAWTTMRVPIVDVEHQIALPDGFSGTALDGAAIAIDGDGTVHAALTTDSPTPMGSGRRDVRLLRADPSCSGWDETGRALLPDVPGLALVAVPPAAYEIRDGEHAITMLLLEPRDVVPVRTELRTFRSPSGAPGTFVADAVGERALLDALDAARPGRFESFDLVRLRRIGDDRIAVVRRWFGDLELWVEQRAGWARVPGADIAPTGEEAAFDADDVVLGELVEDRRTPAQWRGRLFYTGLYDIVDASSTSPVGFGPARVVIRAPGSQMR